MVVNQTTINTIKLMGIATQRTCKCTRDYQERRKLELDQYGAFRSLDRDAQALIAKLAALRSIAREIIQNLPMPKAATLRDKSYFWDRPSDECQKDWPNLFPK